MIAVERHGPRQAVPVSDEKVATLQPILDKLLNKSAHLMSDKHRSYLHIGQQFSAHSRVNHSQRDYSGGQVHRNTAESFSSLFERTRIGVFHFLGANRLSRYLNEFSFRWENRVPVKQRTKFGKAKIEMEPIPIVNMLLLLIMRCSASDLRRTKNWGIQDVAFAKPSFGR